MAAIYYLFFELSRLLFAPVQPAKAEPCTLKGKVFIEQYSPFEATYQVFIEEKDKSAAQLLVFKETNAANAQQPGQWVFTTKAEEADFSVYIVKQKGMEDFSIAYVTAAAEAGCKK